MRNSYRMEADPLITQALTGVRILSNATHDISFESTYCNLQDEWHMKKIQETLDAP